MSCLKTHFGLCKNKGADQLRSDSEADQHLYFVFATQIVQFSLYLYPKFEYSSFLLCVYRPVCVRPGRKSDLVGNPEDQFSCIATHIIHAKHAKIPCVRP